MAYHTLWFDGASRGNGTGSTVAGYGYVLKNPLGVVLVRGSEFLGFGFTNNQAEYKALIAGLRKARALNVAHIHIIGDSELVINQVSGTWSARNVTLIRYRSQALELLEECFTSWSISHARREHNREADALAQEGVDYDYEDYCYGWKAMMQCCYYEMGAWKYLLNQRFRGYWRMKFMLEVIEEQFPDVYEGIEERCYGLDLVESDSSDLAHLLALY